ncbi:hypothetical protein ABZ780_28930 [Micromonospora sp. NPDC047467]|uniref:hypothetical protein n=1 Tax=Micromonospora sp. NPDC047467 TaxID=3154814 RepID=UPI0033D8E832
MDELNVITDALRAEGGKWLQLSDSAAVIKAAAEGLSLDASAFYIGDANVGVHSAAYRDFHAFMVGLLTGATTEFEQVGEALRRVADAYDRADEVVSLDLNTIYTA